MIKKINHIIDSSELVRMAEKHFDGDSTKEMIQELKDNIAKLIGKGKLYTKEEIKEIEAEAYHRGEYSEH